MRALLVAAALAIAVARRRSPTPRNPAPARNVASSARATASASKRRRAGRCRSTPATRRCSSRCVHPGGSRISLAVDRDAPRRTPPRSSSRASRGLRRAGPDDRPRRARPARRRAGRRARRRAATRRSASSTSSATSRAAATRGRRSCVTLATPAADLAAASGPFDWVLAHLDARSARSAPTPSPTPSPDGRPLSGAGCARPQER